MCVGERLLAQIVRSVSDVPYTRELDSIFYNELVSLCIMGFIGSGHPFRSEQNGLHCADNILE